MNAETLAVIGIAATVVGTLAGLFGGWVLGEKSAGRGLLPAKRARKKRLEGNWVGRFHQLGGDPTVLADRACQANFFLRLGRPVGRLSYEFEERRIEVDVKGRFETGDVVTLQYQASQPGVTQFGALVLCLNQYGTELRGGFIGVGNITRLPDLATGSVTLRKEAA